LLEKSDASVAPKNQTEQDAEHNASTASWSGPGRHLSNRHKSYSASPRARGIPGDSEKGVGEHAGEPSSSSHSEDHGGRRNSMTAVHLVERDRQTGRTRLQPIIKSNASATQETPAERRRRVHALKGVNDPASPDSEQRGRSLYKDDDTNGGNGTEKETAAEKRRREAALGMGSGAQDDSDDDDTPRVPPPVVRSRGIRFAESPVRRK